MSFRVRVAPNDSLDNLGDRFEAGNIRIAEISEPVAINIQHAGDAAVGAKERNYYLGPRRRTACDVAWELFHVRNNYGLARRVSVSADAHIKVDPSAGKRPLKRPENELARLFKIESDPKKAKSFLQNRGNISEIRDYVRLACN